MSLLAGAVGGAGDIWSTGAFAFESPLKDLLDSGNYTTEDLLAEDELLQELRGLHPTLTQYFGSEAVVTELLTYVILGPNDEAPASATKGSAAANKEAPPSDEPDGEETTTVDNAPQTNLPPGEWLFRYLEKKEAGEKAPAATTDPVLVHVRFPYMACEILCCELPNTIDTLIEGHVVKNKDGKGIPVEASVTDSSVEVSTTDEKPPRLLDMLFSVLHTTAPGDLDDYRAGYLDKILTVLFRRRPEAMTDYMNTGGRYGLATTQKAMLQHMYSYSIAQIVQRLLLPPRPKPAIQPDENQGEETEPNEPVGQDILGGEEPDEEFDPDMNGAGIKCDWYKSKEAVDWLLELLQGASIGEKPSTMTEEQRLAMSLNASEVFIAVIQNSMLSSATMLALTSIKVWNKLIDAVKPPSTDTFSPHESFQTSAMNVIESLVLQLGGYGAVGTMSLLPEEEETPEEAEAHNAQAHELIADFENLLEVLPNLLEVFAKLLTHPSTKEWRSTMQFSQHEPVPLLGMSRLKIVRVLESLVLLGDPDIDHHLVESGCLRMCLELFWEFQWCSMLHQSVANLLVHVFEGQNVRYEIQEYFLVSCNLIGRLMESFGKAEHVIEQAKAATSGDMVPDAAALTDSADPLPVSEDDVDAAMEVNEEKTENEDTPSNSPVVSQTFRYGYMGHVIIICQALVQACTTEWADSGDSTDAEAGGGALSAQLAQQSPSLPVGQPSIDSTVKTGDTSEMEPLLIAELVKNHELSEQWKEFVETSLSAEISAQSTPLGGYSGPSADPLASHRPGMEAPLGRRPGLADDDEDMDMGPASQPRPPRGMLGGGGTIDMDDNDLDVAAAMLSDFGLGRPNTTATADDSDSDSGQYSGDSDKSYNSGETNNSGGGYAFDDPLGQSGGLGIELGKLTKLGIGGGKKNKPAQAKKEEKADDDDSHSSSSEEPPRPDSDDEDEDNSNGEDQEDNVPVMDLFAGNFNHGQVDPGDDKPPESKEPPKFDEFANFDAFPGGPPSVEFAENKPVLESPEMDVFAKAPPPDLDVFEATPSPVDEDDGFGDFVGADPAPETDGEPVTQYPPSVDSTAAGSTQVVQVSTEKESTAVMDPFALDDIDNDSAAGVFKTTFTGKSFDDIADLNTAPSDELEADAMEGVPDPEAPTQTPATKPDSDDSPAEDQADGVLVS